MVSLLQGLLRGIQEKTASPHSPVVTAEPWGFIINYIHKNVSGYVKSKMELKWLLLKEEVF